MSRFPRLTLPGLACIGVFALAACEMGPYEDKSPEVRYPIEVELRTFQAPVPLRSVRADGLDALPAGFVSEWRRRGEGPLRLTLPREPGAAAAGNRLARALRAEAVEVEIVRDAAEGPHIEASFLGAVALVPTCGNYQDGTIHNPNRWPHLDFGCSYQRNIGLMVANPRDLRGGPPPGAMEAPRAIGGVQDWRAGEPLGSPRPVGEGDGLSGLGD